MAFINEFPELCTRANAGPPYTQGFHSFMYKNTHQAVPNRRGGTCPEMCGVITVRTGKADHEQGTLRTAGTAPETGVSQDGSGICQQLWGGNQCGRDDLSSYNPPCLEAACHSPEALPSQGVKLSKGRQGEWGCQEACRVRYFRIRVTDHVAAPAPLHPERQRVA